jgi:hypothetical protein
VVDDDDFRVALQRARWDIDYFALRFLGIQGHPGQQRFWNTGLMRLEDGWRAAYLTIAVSAGNRAGKTLGLAVYILHSTLFKLGLPAPLGDKDRSLMAWLKTPYDWWHFGLQGEVAELVHLELTRILSGTHPAQKGRGCLLAEALGPEVANTTTKERGDYPWVQLHPALGGGQIHFRSTSERALGSLGKEMNGISWDECAFSSDFDFVVDEVLHNRRLGSGGQLILISTSTEGLTAFTDRWNLGDPSAPDRSPEAMSLRISTRDNVGYGLDEVTFGRLLQGMPPYLIPQNIDGYAIEAKSAFFGAQSVDAMFTKALPEDDMPQDGHRYAQGVDPALTFDSTWAVTLDMTNPEQIIGVRARRKTGRQTTLSVSALVAEGHRTFTTQRAMCYTAIDATGFGGKVFYDLLNGLHPMRAVEFGGARSKKLRLLLDLKAGIEKGRMRLPRHGIWLALRRQLLGYKLNDRKIQTDAVMALAVAWHEVMRQPSKVADDTTFDFYAGTVEPVRQAGVPLQHFGQRRVTVGRLNLTERE